MADTNFTDTVTLTDDGWFNDANALIYLNAGQVILSSVAGTNTITATCTPAQTAYKAGQVFWLVPSATNTGATTVNIGGLGAKNVFAGGAALIGGELKQNVPVGIEYDGTQFNLIGESSSTASWTPVLTFETVGNLSVTYSTQVGRYKRRGNLCQVWFQIATSAFTHTTASGDLRITGLPATSVNISGLQAIGSADWQGITKANYTQINPRIDANVAYIDFRASGSAQSLAAVGSGDVPSGGMPTIRGSISYLCQ